MKMVLFFPFICLFVCLRADIDGTITPSIVNHRYTFTDGERADGAVYFRKGFDLPVSGTVRLNIISGAEIDGDINFNNGTLILEKDTDFGPDTGFFYGPGFITGGGIEMRIARTLRLTNTFFIFGQNFQVVGKRKVSFAPLGVLDLSHIRFINMSNIVLGISSQDQLVTSSSMPEEISFNDANINNGSGATPIVFSQPITNFIGECEVKGGPRGVIFDQDIVVRQSSRVALGIGTDIVLGGLNILSGNAELVLNSGILDFSKTSATSDTLFIGDPINFQGRLVVNGSSILRSSAGNPLELADRLSLQLMPGARLVIDSETKLTVL